MSKSVTSTHDDFVRSFFGSALGEEQRVLVVELITLHEELADFADVESRKRRDRAGRDCAGYPILQRIVRNAVARVGRKNRAEVGQAVWLALLEANPYRARVLAMTQMRRWRPTIDTLSPDARSALHGFLVERFHVRPKSPAEVDLIEHMERTARTAVRRARIDNLSCRSDLARKIRRSDKAKARDARLASERALYAVGNIDAEIDADLDAVRRVDGVTARLVARTPPRADDLLIAREVLAEGEVLDGLVAVHRPQGATRRAKITARSRAIRSLQELAGTRPRDVAQSVFAIEESLRLCSLSLPEADPPIRGPRSGTIGGTVTVEGLGRRRPIDPPVSSSLVKRRNRTETSTPI